jgi:hypothetical protein
MIDFVQLILGVDWWFRLLRRSPVRARVVLIAVLIAAVVLLMGIWRLTDPRLDVLLFAVVVLALTAVCLWANLTAPGPSRELPMGSDEWRPPSAQEITRVINGGKGNGATD